uniref:Uncharacterized protein n=1 Tax=Arundo donax TaxID=35708 RepID=A0A0A9DV91_ARUDO
MVPAEVPSLPGKKFIVESFQYNSAIFLRLNIPSFPTGFIRVIALCCPC